MSWTQYIDGCGSDKILLTQAIEYATQALQKIEAQEKAEEKRQEALKMNFLKQTLFGAAFARFKEQLDKEIKEMITECYEEDDPPTAQDVLEDVLFNMTRTIKAALYEEYHTLRGNDKWVRGVEELNGRELLEWSCFADECWYENNHDRMSTEIPVYKSRWCSRVILCDVCFENMNEQDVESILLKNIKRKLMEEFNEFIKLKI